MLVFFKIWGAFFSCNTCFEICPFALLPEKIWKKTGEGEGVSNIGKPWSTQCEQKLKRTLHNFTPHLSFEVSKNNEVSKNRILLLDLKFKGVDAILDSELDIKFIECHV